MPDFKKLDSAFRLSPWTIQAHADYVAGQYGSLLQDPKLAEDYREGYIKAEKAFDEAYAMQGEMLSRATVLAGEKPQKLPAIEKLDWDPRKRFALPEKPKKVKEEKNEEVEEPKVEEKAEEMKEEKKPKKVRGQTGMAQIIS